MEISKKWTIDNAYINNNYNCIDSPFNHGCMCVFENTSDGKVNHDVALFAKKNGKKEGLLYNNRLYISIANPQKKNRLQYEKNRDWIITNIE